MLMKKKSSQQEPMGKKTAKSAGKKTAKSAGRWRAEEGNQKKKKEMLFDCKQKGQQTEISGKKKQINKNWGQPTVNMKLK